MNTEKDGVVLTVPTTARPQVGPRPGSDATVGQKLPGRRRHGDRRPALRPNTVDTPDHGPTKVPVDEGAGRRSNSRLIGVDAARGLALFGMIAVHTLPIWNRQTGEATLSWMLFSGSSAALFATLAGVSLAFSSGGRVPRTGQRLKAARASVAGRAAVLAIAGFTLGFLPVPVPNILIYYGMFFLIAVPLLGLRIRHLLISSALFALIAPFLMQWSLTFLPAHVHMNPSLVDLATNPKTVLAELLLTGAYPALPWMTFLCAGLALGRMDLASPRVQLWLAASGAALGFLAYAASMSVLLALGGYDRIWSATPWMTEDQIDEIIVFGPDPSLPTTTLWWLVVPGPHTNTPFSLLMGLGIAMGTLGCFLLLSRVIGKYFTVLAATGGMTFTLYSLHLVYLSLGLHYQSREFWFCVQIMVFLLFAMTWKRFMGQGPLERIVAWISKDIGRRVLARGSSERPAPRTS